MKAIWYQNCIKQVSQASVQHLPRDSISGNVAFRCDRGCVEKCTHEDWTHGAIYNNEWSTWFIFHWFWPTPWRWLNAFTRFVQWGDYAKHGNNLAEDDITIRKPVHRIVSSCKSCLCILHGSPLSWKPCVWVLKVTQRFTGGASGWR